MSTHESYENVADSEFNDHNKPVIITFDVENISSVPNTIDTIKSGFNISETFPFSLFSLVVPILQCNLGLRMQSIVFNDYPLISEGRPERPAST